MSQLQSAALCGRMIPVALSCLAMVLSGCAETHEDAPIEADSADAACELLVETINSAEGYREASFNPESRIGGCTGTVGEEDSGLTVLRLNAVCREEVCGSVLMGWYAVDLEAGRVWEWDTAEWQVGDEISSSPRT